MLFFSPGSSALSGPQQAVQHRRVFSYKTKNNTFLMRREDKHIGAAEAATLISLPRTEEPLQEKLH